MFSPARSHRRMFSCNLPSVTAILFSLATIASSKQASRLGNSAWTKCRYRSVFCASPSSLCIFGNTPPRMQKQPLDQCDTYALHELSQRFCMVLPRAWRAAHRKILLSLQVKYVYRRLEHVIMVVDVISHWKTDLSFSFDTFSTLLKVVVSSPLR